MPAVKDFLTLFSQKYDFDTYCQLDETHGERVQLAFQTTKHLLTHNLSDILNSLDYPLKVLTIAETWCGDCANGVPVISALANHLPSWEFGIVSRDDFPEIVDERYSTAGRRKIPVVIFANKEGEEVARWVERPASSYLLINQLKEERLPKEEYITKYRSSAELQPPLVCGAILDELLSTAEKCVATLRVLPQKQQIK